MERVTMSIEGTAEEVQQALQTLAGVAGRRAASPAEARVQAGTTMWTLQQAARFWQQLAPEARRILRELARRPEGYPQEELGRALVLRGREIGGRLSSVGHAMRRFPGKPHAVVRARASDGGSVYRMDSEVARFIQTLGEQQQAA